MPCQNRTYVGFGFGAIQPGLLLFEAFRSKAFRRHVIAEILPELVVAMRQAHGMYTLNIASQDGVHQITLGPVELVDVAFEDHRQQLIAAVAVADEIGTAITTFNQYVMDIPGSLHLMLAEGLQRKVEVGGPPAVVYCAENNNHAAEILQQAVMSQMSPSKRDAVNARVQFLNTVISKMCGIVRDPGVIQANNLVPMWQHNPASRALLVEDYDVLLINQVNLSDFQRGISIFEEKEDLLPFKEAKLFGHNGTHAIASYMGGHLGVTRMTELASHPEVMTFLRTAFLDEIGVALCQKYEGYDPLFTSKGFMEFVDGILQRMVNPYLLDTVARVGRDPRRKLGWEDRLIGAVRLALAHGVQPVRYAFGAAAALAAMDMPVTPTSDAVSQKLLAIWHPESAAAPVIPSEQELAVINTVTRGMERFINWQKTGFALDFLNQI